MSLKKLLPKRWQRVLFWIAVPVVVLLLIVGFALGPVVKHVVPPVVKAVAGVEMKVGTARVYPFSGSVLIKDVVVGPPEGYISNLAELDEFHAKVDIGSLFTDTIVVKDITVRRPVVSYELGDLPIHSNLGKLSETLKGKAEEEKKARKEKKDAEAGPAKNIQIDHFLFEDCKVRIASTLAGGRALSINVSNIERNDLGKDGEGIGPLEIVSIIVEAVVETVVKTAAGAVLDVGGAAIDGAAAVGGAAVDGVKAVGGAAVDGVKAVGGAIGSLFGGGKDEKKDAEKDEKKDAE